MRQNTCASKDKMRMREAMKNGEVACKGVPREIEVEKSSGNEGKGRHDDDLQGRKAARREGHDQPEIEAIREHQGRTGRQGEANCVPSNQASNCTPSNRAVEQGGMLSPSVDRGPSSMRASHKALAMQFDVTTTHLMAHRDTRRHHFHLDDIRQTPRLQRHWGERTGTNEGGITVFGRRGV
ncbi:hypothetical protein BC826DRAFT_1179137 [Russula brevipes]|nr:hypothetical protein BC826DRAFT_1179137 [Russula brevipes]